MINLIPQRAKKNIVTEYWTRVISTWLLLWAFALICGAAILFPAYILVSSQVAVYEKSAASASEKVSDYKSASVALVRASKQASEIVERAKVTSVSSYFDLFTKLQGSEIKIDRINLKQEGTEILPVSISGIAANRQSLSSFRDRMLEQPLIAEVDLPISNLAADKDIRFSITVTMTNPTEV